MRAKVTPTSRSKYAFIILSVVVFAIILRLAYIQLVKGGEYSALVTSQQLGDSEIKAARGNIYDANMNVLAQSASVWLCYINPSEINGISDETKREAVRDIVVVELSEIFGLDEEKVRAYTQKQDTYVRVMEEVEKNKRDEVLEFIERYKKLEENPVDLSAVIGFEPDVKRYYPYSSLASTVIGFTGRDSVGLYGLEYYYDETLSGVSGRSLTALDAHQSLMPNQYQTIYEAQQGNGLVLTIDIYIQHILEDVLGQALEETLAENVYGIVMDVDTGAILAMTSLPDFDLNSPWEIKSETLLTQYTEYASAEEGATEEPIDEQLRSKQHYLDVQWSNRAITSTYEPGSVFKIITASAAVEEGIADASTEYYCSGSIDYATRTIRCWKYGGHGAETFLDLLKNSCNPFTVTIADKIGTQLYYDYFEAFGFTEKTGVDTGGDFSPTAGVLYMERDKFSQSDLASYSFGQTFQVSPLQVITAVSAVANGGKLMTPYLVAREVDEDCNTVKEHTPVVRRQVISEETAAFIRENMEQVVSSGTGKNAYVAGYHVAGKTGTSEKLTVGEDAYIASFCGFAPAYDPEIAVIIVVDEPQGQHGGGAVAAPLAGEVFESVLTYMGTEHSYTDEEMQLLLETAPSLVGKSLAQARSEVSSNELTIKVIGDGDTVVGQYPDAGRELPKQGVIVVYTQENYTSEKVTVPDFTGCTVSQANRLAANSGLNIRISGSSLDTSTVFAYKQSIEAGEEIDMGEIITVSFKTTVDVDD